MLANLSPDKRRISSVDLLRGAVMIIMALDHTRDFFHYDAQLSNPLNLNTTTPILFFTRWITHFCAPVFVFLSGASAFLQSARKSKKELSLFLISRGLWLILAELTIVNFIFSFDIYYSIFALEVIWAIGISMVILGLVIWLPFELILAIGLLIVLGHNSLDFYERGKRPDSFGVGYNLLHRVGFHPLWGKHNLFIFYPFLPWTGLMMLGYCLGKVLRNDNAAYRKRFLVIAGLSTIALFSILRFINIYGDPFRWSEQPTGFRTFLSFINTSKYPPSLFFISMTIGPALLLLAWWDTIQNAFTKIVSVYGRVPFFYFVVHFFILHLFTTITFFLRGHTYAEGMADQGFTKFVKPGEGFTLTMVYVIWIAVVITLYPLCKWYDNYKTRHKEKKWLSYL